MVRLILTVAILLQAFGGLLAVCPVEECAADPAGMPAALAGACCPESNQDAGMPAGHGRCVCSVSVKLTHGVADRVAAKPSTSAPEQIQRIGDPAPRAERVLRKVSPEGKSICTMSPDEWRSRIRVRVI